MQQQRSQKILLNDFSTSIEFKIKKTTNESNCFVMDILWLTVSKVSSRIVHICFLLFFFIFLFIWHGTWKTTMPTATQLFRACNNLALFRSASRHLVHESVQVTNKRKVHVLSARTPVGHRKKLLQIIRRWQNAQVYHFRKAVAYPKWFKWA